MQDSGSPSFPSSRMLRASRDPNRRNSHNAMALNDDRPTGTSQESSESDRDRHWNTILGQTPGQTEQASSSQTFSNSSRPGHSRHTIAPLRSPHSRVPSSSRTPRRASTQTSTDLGSAARPSRSPTTKPFACDQCVRRFERKGHLKVSHIQFEKVWSPFSISGH